jgi:hypothetical protein
MDPIRQRTAQGGKVSLEILTARGRVDPLRKERGIKPARAAQLPGVRLFFCACAKARSDSSAFSKL